MFLKDCLQSDKTSLKARAEEACHIAQAADVARTDGSTVLARQLEAALSEHLRSLSKRERAATLMATFEQAMNTPPPASSHLRLVHSRD